MTPKSNSTRRSFLKRGALLAAPLAAVAPAAMFAEGGLKTRLARLENEAAIREVHQTWLRSINSGTADGANPLASDFEGIAPEEIVRGISVDHVGEPDAIEVAANGKSAAGRFHCAVEIETAIAQDCTLAQMAHAQGSGFVRRTERRVLNVKYVKSADAWSIAKAEFEQA